MEKSVNGKSAIKCKKMLVNGEKLAVN